MYSYIKGTVKYLGDKYIVLECNNIGYHIQTSTFTISDLQIQDEITMYTHMVVNDAGIFLYGFSKIEELDMYKLLNKVSSIGPRSALAILSTLSVNQIKLSIINNDYKSLQKAPGVGKKTAGKIIIELQDRIDKNELIEDNEIVVESKVSNSENYNIAKDALINLGYTRYEISKVLDKIDVNSLELEDIIKLALVQLS